MKTCESTSSIVLDLWKEYGKLATQAGCAAAGIATANPATVVACVATVKKTEEIAKKLITFWNKMAGNSWAKLGHRSLSLGTSETGTILGPGDRTFVTPSPLTSDTVQLILDETDGKGETDVDICLVSSKGKCTKVKSYSFNDTAAGKRGHGKVEPKIENALGKYLVVTLNGKSVTNKFEYKITLKKVTTATAVHA
ncbi:MAG TPA: hypothetical protein VJY62_08725 [Bacteroidia bacterium]|nr:hypothetical protein [Bacteroidia bacterium]